ncbi:hypothetical protein N7540_000933 [Penicillium herquei]|nr:hypothetical protein N7540_000933 [Penicillium herquei]
MAPTKDKATPAKPDKVVKTQASMRAGRNRKFGNVMSEDNFHFMWTCLEGVQVDYRTVAGKLGISYSAANQRYYNLRDYFKHLAELEGRALPATSGRGKGSKKPAKKDAKKNTKAKGKGKARAKSEDDDTSIDLTQDDDHVDLTRDDEYPDNLSDVDEAMTDASSAKGELYDLIKKEIDEAEKEQTLFFKTENEKAKAGPAEKAEPAEKTGPVEDAGQAGQAEAEQGDEDDLPDYEDAKDVQDEEDVDVA